MKAPPRARKTRRRKPGLIFTLHKDAVVALRHE